MNILVGWLLIHVGEEDAFWILCAIVEYLCPRYYTQNMLGCQVHAFIYPVILCFKIDLRVFRELLTQNFSIQQEYLEGQAISIPLICTKVANGVREQLIHCSGFFAYLLICCLLKY